MDLSASRLKSGSEPLFEPKVEPVVDWIAKGVDPGQGRGGILSGL